MYEPLEGLCIFFDKILCRGQPLWDRERFLNFTGSAQSFELCLPFVRLENKLALVRVILTDDYQSEALPLLVKKLAEIESIDHLVLSFSIQAKDISNFFNLKCIYSVKRFEVYSRLFPEVWRFVADGIGKMPAVNELCFEIESGYQELFDRDAFKRICQHPPLCLLKVKCTAPPDFILDVLLACERCPMITFVASLPDAFQKHVHSFPEQALAISWNKLCERGVVSLTEDDAHGPPAPSSAAGSAFFPSNFFSGSSSQRSVPSPAVMLTSETSRQASGIPLQDTRAFVIPSTEAASHSTQHLQTVREIRNMFQEFPVDIPVVKVAVLDTGCDVLHPELNENIMAVRSFVPTQHAWLDLHGHGTHCTGIVGGLQTGVAPHVHLYIGKVLADQPVVYNGDLVENGYGDRNCDWLVEGLKWAYEQEVDIVSLSLGMRGCNERVFKIIHEMIAAGLVIISAAANEGANYRYSIGYPARFGTVLCIGSHGDDGHPSDFSAVGRELDFLAPGEGILSTWPNNQVKAENGTSMATPFVAGLVANLLLFDRISAKKVSNITHVRALLREMSTKPGSHDDRCGHGRLNPMEFFKRLQILGPSMFDYIVDTA